MTKEVRIGQRRVGPDEPVYVIAEIGINHNGSVELAKRLIDGAVLARCDAVKFQKRTPELCVPRDQWEVMRDTPWGRMTYLAYRHRIEFDADAYAEIDRYCEERDIAWFASCWDEEAVDFMARFDTPCIKAASASISDLGLLAHMARTGRPVMISTGMSTYDEIDAAVRALSRAELLVAHTTSAYPCPAAELNLRMIATLKERYPACPIGYSGHEAGIAPTLAAVAMGACFVERHITLDRGMWGSDQAASIDIGALMTLVAQIRDIERSLGDGVKQVYASEHGPRARLRRVETPVANGAYVHGAGHEG
jgi:N-acetylneuraminate synthase